MQLFFYLQQQFLFNTERMWDPKYQSGLIAYDLAIGHKNCTVQQWTANPSLWVKECHKDLHWFSALWGQQDFMASWVSNIIIWSTCSHSVLLEDELQILTIPFLALKLIKVSWRKELGGSNMVIDYSEVAC